ncbi:uncharacterized protein LOC141809992 isoform X2 [Halichoeres trimaculatus]|uniref:uncharacterized protein LOC141809992 isoform X2 n=1 Tax=Halichoeres trimaculatus TaxID=147232 RepID=UPI003D9EF680
MSAVCLKLLTILSVCCTALSASESSGAIWKDPGDSITIQCRFPTKDQSYMYLKKGLNDFDVFFRQKGSEKDTIATGFKSRLQTHGVFPNVDILIRNLTSDDTDPYWCEYQKISMSPQKTKGQGSVLLVVNRESTAQQCGEPNKDLVLVSVVISAVVLLGILLAFFVWIIKTKALRTTVKPQRVSNNDVYEDMRGTVRR